MEYSARSALIACKYRKHREARGMGDYYKYYWYRITIEDVCVSGKVNLKLKTDGERKTRLFVETGQPQQTQEQKELRVSVAGQCRVHQQTNTLLLKIIALLLVSSSHASSLYSLLPHLTPSLPPFCQTTCNT